MKTRILYLVIVVLLIINCGLANAQISVDLKNALIDGNSQQLAKFFSKNIELLINQKEDVYSKAQAELIIKDFFVKHQPDTFKIENEGANDGVNYTIGNLITSNGKYRVYLTYLKSSGKQYISRLIITEYK